MNFEELSSGKCRIFKPCLPESPSAEIATVASAAGSAIRQGIIATVGQSVVHAQGHAFSNDVRLGEMKQWGADFQVHPAFNAGFGGQIGHFFECRDIFGAAVGIAAVIHCVHTDKDFRNL